MTMIQQSVDRLEQYMMARQFRGYDPYDMLKSPLFRLPGVRKAKKIRFLAQQFGKRFPVNLRKLLFIPKGNNPVTLGLSIQAYSYLSKAHPERANYYLKQIEMLLDELERLIPEGFSGACWGYDFDWQARRAEIPGYQPTIVATGIITNGLFECWQLTNIQKCADLIVSSAQFVLKDLNKTYEGSTFCYSYSPFDHQIVLNASMKGVRLLSQAYAITKDEYLLNETLPAAQFVINCQNKDGSFVYSDKGNWIDNYHTGYVLDCLDEFAHHFENNTFDENIKRGFEFYKTNFFTPEGAPKFYSQKLYPIDCTSAAQSMLTLGRFDEQQMAENVAIWMINSMQARNGSFYFRKFKSYTVRTSFMRWSNAWMFASMAYLIYRQKRTNESVISPGTPGPFSFI